MQNPSKIDQNAAKERSGSDLVSKSAQCNPPGSLVEMNLAGLWRHLGDFGRHFGPSWAPRGSPNRAFWHQVAPKSQKMRPRMRHQKIYEILIEIF